jgi:predicted metal-dependent hydrolase
LYTIKLSSSAKYVRLEINSETGLTVVIPKSYKLDRIPDLLREKGRWVLSKLAKYNQARSSMAEKELKSGDTIPYLGQDMEVVTQQIHGNADTVKLDRNKLIVGIRANSGRLHLALEWWYRMQAGKLIREKVDKLSAHFGVRYNRLIIRGQKTRWGSCSKKGNLSFNWKLMMVPEPVIDYVIIHEIAHLKEMNHTKKFWRLVAQQCPGWRQHKKWLKDHTAELAAKLPA